MEKVNILWFRNGLRLHDNFSLHKAVKQGKVSENIEYRLYSVKQGKVSEKTLSTDCTLGWSDFHFLAIFENGHIAIDWLYFYEFNSKKSASFATCARAAKFLLYKNHRDLESENFF